MIHIFIFVLNVFPLMFLISLEGWVCRQLGTSKTCLVEDLPLIDSFSHMLEAPHPRKRTLKPGSGSPQTRIQFLPCI